MLGKKGKQKARGKKKSDQLEVNCMETAGKQTEKNSTKEGCDMGTRLERAT